MKKLNLPVAVNSYFWLTVISWTLMIASFVLSFPAGWYFIWVFGCHTTFFPFFALLMLAETELAWLAISIWWFWGVYLIGFVWAYFWAVWAKGYLPMAIMALIDTIFSTLIVVFAIINAGFMSVHLLIVIGAFLSLVITLLLFRGIADSKKSHDEIPWN